MIPVVLYETPAGGAEVSDCLKSFSKADRKILGEDLMVVQMAFPVGPPLCAPLGQGLWEVRSSLSGNRIVRMIFYHNAAASKLVVLRVFQKKTQKTPKRELDLALARKREFSP